MVTLDGAFCLTVPRPTASSRQQAEQSSLKFHARGPEFPDLSDAHFEALRIETLD